MALPQKKRPEMGMAMGRNSDSNSHVLEFRPRRWSYYRGPIGIKAGLSEVNNLQSHKLSLMVWGATQRRFCEATFPIGQSVHNGTPAVPRGSRPPLSLLHTWTSIHAQACMHTQFLLCELYVYDMS